MRVEAAIATCKVLAEPPAGRRGLCAAGRPSAVSIPKISLFVKYFPALYRRLPWLNLPGALLVALLQRTPVLPLAATMEEFALVSPVGAVLRAAVAAAASLGAMHSLAGATQFFATHNPIAGTTGSPIATTAVTVNGAQSPPGSFRITAGSLPPGISITNLNTTTNLVNGSSVVISGTPTTAGNFSILLRAYEFANAQGDSFPATAGYTVSFVIGAGSASAPVITTPPASQAASAGANLTLTVAGTGTPAPALQWQQNGAALAGQTSASLVLGNLQPANAGLYTVSLTNSAGSVTSDSAIVGVTTTSKAIGAATVVGTDIVHPNKNVFDQVLLTGAAATVTADAGKVTRTSFIDLADNIVQVEFSGNGTLSLVLDAASGPAAPVNYNQATNYMKGHAGIVITGADDTTNVSIFTVGRATAFDPTGGYNILLPPSATNDPANNGSPLFQGHSTTVYDGLANVAFVAISTTNGKFGGLRASDGSFFATTGLTGVYAPGVQFQGPVFIGDIDAAGSATPAIMIGSSPDTRITGGDLKQDNGLPVKVSGLTQLKFTAGTNSGGATLPAQANQAVLMQGGVDVTNSVVVNSSSP